MEYGFRLLLLVHLQRFGRLRHDFGIASFICRAGESKEKPAEEADCTFWGCYLVGMVLLKGGELAVLGAFVLLQNQIDALYYMPFYYAGVLRMVSLMTG